eukprot:TRINITY_DN397_c0_g1_i1.p1 TRINITY_DN397_c0_g1~~TRINITY_DN397_c0_g1_i1.p1  ORF type:complete len:560 (-),score=127.86 TRINITY_DN397_c0_g1_i1:24-1652(-)
MKSAVCLLVLCCTVLSVLSAGYHTVYFNPSNGNYSVQNGMDRENGVAWAEYSNEVNQTGWGRFNLESSELYQDAVQAYGAGYLEGYVTYEVIWYSWYNTYVNSFKGSMSPPEVLKKWFTSNIAWVSANANILKKRDPYWAQVELLLQQLRGLVAGYNAAQPVQSRHMDLVDMMILNSAGDLETIQNVVGTSNSDEDLSIFGSHCSSIVKLTDDLSDLFAGHTTWTTYWNMLRTFKRYELRFRENIPVAFTSLFSSYPACLSSIDDFYQLSSGLVVIETTNGCFNTTLRDEHVHPHSVLSWMRIVVANRLATSGQSWIDFFSRHNSGTYNNQWILVDYSRFTPYQPLQDGTLWIAEQIPGKVISTDATHYLRLGYWPSFNIPFFQETYDTCMFPSIREKYGSWMTYSLSPRGQIFRRDNGKVLTLNDTANILRYNDWQHDPLAAGSPGNQISSRFDLVPKDAHPTNPYLLRNAFGGIDSKVTSRELLKRGQVWAQSGPTRGGAKSNLPAFDWREWANTGGVHEGLPQRFDFPWVVMPEGRRAY